MTVNLDHTILEVEDLADSVVFYRDLVGLEHRGRSGGFEVMLITPDLALDLIEASVPASRHLAFGMDRGTFDATFERIRTGGIGQRQKNAYDRKRHDRCRCHRSLRTDPG